MSQMNVIPVQWSMFKDIDDVAPLSEEDYPVLSDIRDVLRRHEKLSRFGVALLHSHFELEPGEIMVESADKAQRVLKLEPVRKEPDTIELMGTIWALADGELSTMAWCRRYCARWVFGHDKAHQNAR